MEVGEFWRPEHQRAHPAHEGRVFAVELPAAEFLAVLDGLAAALAR